MKSALIALSLVSLNAFAGGTEIAGGVMGKPLMGCQNKDHTIGMGIRIQPGRGAVLSLSQNGKLVVSESVVPVENDPRGGGYKGAKVSVLIPHTQVPGGDGYTAIVTIKGRKGAIFLTCH